MEPRPDVFIPVLQDCDALAGLFPELAAPSGQCCRWAPARAGGARTCASHCRYAGPACYGCTTSADSQQPVWPPVDTSTNAASAEDCQELAMLLGRYPERRVQRQKLHAMHCSTYCSISTSTGSRSASSSSSRLVKHAWQARPAGCAEADCHLAPPALARAVPVKPLLDQDSRCRAGQSAQCCAPRCLSICREYCSKAIRARCGGWLRIRSAGVSSLPRH